MTKNATRLFGALLPALTLWAGHAGAEEDQWSLCKAPVYEPFVIPPPLPEGTDPQVDIDSDEAHYDVITEEATFQGGVDLRYQAHRLKSDNLYYLKDKEQFLAKGGVEYSNSELGLIIESRDAQFHSETEYVEFADARYRLIPRHARGIANRISRKTEDAVKLRNATYTTCSDGDNAWSISGKDVVLDQESGRGTARNVVFRIKDVPVAYTPYASFPIDDRRKTGFLAPSFGTTNNSGTEVLLPFYWNMAPNYDMTLTPRYLSDRGLQLQSNFRYMFPRDQEGRLQLEYLKDDKTDQDRWAVDFEDRTKLTNNWNTNLIYRDVSDSQYFEDLGTTLAQSSQAHLLQQGMFSFSNGPWRLQTRVQNFKTIDDSILKINRPYKRLPQIIGSFRLPDRALGLGYSFRGEWVHFDKDAGVTGNRLDAVVGVDWPLVRPGYFAIPKAQLRYTNYALDDTDDRYPNSPTRTIPTFSFDSGLIFDRPIGDGSTVQTLEPRLFYLYTPTENQDNLPVFDTSQFEFTYAQLFRDNQFTGPDRISNANQLTTAITTSWIDTQSGQELFSASVGQIFYFTDLKVTLPNQTPYPNSSSNIVGDLSLNLNERWLASGTTRWDPHTGTHERTAVRLRYKAPKNRIVNLGYSFRSGEFKQTDISFSWPLTPSWHAVGRWNYDLRNERDIELLGGIEYESCCWAVRLVGRKFFTDSEESEFNTSVMVQLVFKGLTKVGSNIGSQLERSIIGYEEEF